MVGHQRLYQYFDTIIWICLPICIFYFAYVNNLLHNSLYYEMSPLELMIPIYLSKMMYRFWWLGVYKDVWCFLQTCPKCQTYSIVQSLNITTSNTQLAPLHVHYRLLRCQAQPHILCVKSIHASNRMGVSFRVVECREYCIISHSPSIIPGLILTCMYTYLHKFYINHASFPKYLVMLIIIDLYFII